MMSPMSDHSAGETEGDASQPGTTVSGVLATTGSPEFRRKRRNESWILPYVEVVEDPDTKLKHWECKACQYPFSTTTSHSTVARHVRRHLSNDEEEVDEQLTNVNAHRPAERYPRDSRPFLVRVMALIQFICGLNLSLQVLDRAEFLHYSLALDPAFIVPCFQTFRQLIFARTKELEQDLINFLQHAHHISLTADLWSSHNHAFIGITVHFMDRQFNLHHRTLGILRFQGSHTGIAIRNAVHSAVSRFVNISNILSITTDGASNMIAFAEASQIPRLSCFAHSLQLIIRAGLDSVSIQTTIKACRRIVEFFRRSILANEVFHKHQQRDVKVNLSAPGLTRWSGDATMLADFVELKGAIIAALTELNMFSVPLPDEVDDQPQPTEQPVGPPAPATPTPLAQVVINFDIQEQQSDTPPAAPATTSVRATTLLLSEDQWALVAELATILRPYAIRTTHLNSPHCFLSDVAAHAVAIQESWDQTNTPLELEMVTRMRAKSESLRTFPFITVTGPESKHMVNMAMDPRYKSRKCIKPATWKAARSEALTLPNSTASPSFARQSKTSELQQLLDGPKHDNLVQTSAVDAEFAAYRSCPDLTATSKDDVLLWWSKQATCLPILSQLAAKYFTMQATEVPSERLFSEAGRVFTDARASMDPSLLAALVFVHDNDEQLIAYRSQQRK